MAILFKFPIVCFHCGYSDRMSVLLDTYLHKCFLPGCLLEVVENTCVDLRFWWLDGPRPWLLSLVERWRWGNASDFVWPFEWDDMGEDWGKTVSVFRPTSYEEWQVGECWRGTSSHHTDNSFSTINTIFNGILYMDVQYNASSLLLIEMCLSNGSSQLQEGISNSYVTH